MPDLKSVLFGMGHVVHSKDNERGHNEGLSRREIKALEEENTSPWGRKVARNKAIEDRARKAKR